MEAVGLVVGVIGVQLHLIFATDKAIDALKHLKLKQKTIDDELIPQLQILKEVLLLVRDTTERLATDDTTFETMLNLTEIHPRLHPVLQELKEESLMIHRRLPMQSAYDSWVQDRSKVIQEICGTLQQWLRLELTTTSNATILERPNTEIRTDTRWLDGPNFSKTLASLLENYEPGIGDWVLGESSFKRWESQSGRTLWCSGRPGVGKSVLCSIVVNHLINKFAEQQVPVIFVFLDFSARQTLDSAAILKSLLQQLSQYSGRSPSLINRLHEKHILLSAPPTLKELWEYLRHELTRFNRVFVVLDALDEYCQGTEVFFYDFQTLFDFPTTSIFVTSRLISGWKAPLEDIDELELGGRDSDIRQYVHQNLLGSWLVQYPQLHASIAQILIEKSNGMFLWVSLALKDVLSRSTINEVENALLNLPRDLAELYESRIRSILDQGSVTRCLVLEILSWLAYTSEPLTIRQLQQVVRIQVGEDHLSHDDVPVSRLIKEVCAGLVIVEPNEQLVMLSHHSFREWLVHYMPTITHLLPGSEEPNAFIAKKCLALLSFKDFSTTAQFDQEVLRRLLDQYVMVGYAARCWGVHAQLVPLHVIFDNIMTHFKSWSNTMFAGLVMSTCEQHPGHYERAYQGMHGLHICAYFGIAEVMERMITTKETYPDVVTQGGWTALHWAARRGWAKAVAVLLLHGASTTTTTNLDEWNALHLAAKEGKSEVVEILVKTLVESGAGINDTDKLHRTALYLATWGGHEDVVNQLLAHSAQVNIPNNYGATVLHCAIKRGHEAIVERLLVPDIRNDLIDEFDQVGLTALDEANRKKNQNIINMLINAGASLGTNTNGLSDHHDDVDLDWETYEVNEEKTRKLQKGSQCVCHVLEKSQQYMAFRKTYALSSDEKGLVHKYLNSEHLIMHRIRHPNIVLFLDFSEDPEQNVFLLYTEYCDIGDLKTCHGRETDADDTCEDDNAYGFYPEDPSTKGQTTPLDGQETWTMIAQLGMALAYLHYGLAIRNEAAVWKASFEAPWHNILHRDIKPANVVMSSSKSGCCTFKLCDLGIASEAGKGAGHNTTQLIGTRGFLPPEVNRGNHWTTKGDIFSLGETIRDTKKLDGCMFGTEIELLIDQCTKRNKKLRPSSLDIIEDSYKHLQGNDVFTKLAPPFQHQIQAISELLCRQNGGYILEAFNHLAAMLDDIIPLEDRNTKESRRQIMERLGSLWEDGAEKHFWENLNEFSLHILVLLLSLSKEFTKTSSLRSPVECLERIISEHSNVNVQWLRSRWTPLHLAMQEGAQEVIEYLILRGASESSQDVHGRIPASYT
ncbi:uncharacterized protein FTOL_09974 [Fusarium torulosum]|uniref:Serine/threonine protein kinase n=1 Tax=Fusarium torulosum TaxID=33205 RepID=A0AAE8MH63_9HYPO|nr:uncharacterized protein FTOL_09974 [Fusarium torulosum]